MAKKIRVYELARELGLTSKEALDLAIALGIGVKSPSSSIEDAQADRVRRKADADGLRRDVAPEEPEPTKAKQKSPTSSSGADKSSSTPTGAPQTSSVSGAPIDSFTSGVGQSDEASRGSVASRSDHSIDAADASIAQQSQGQLRSSSQSETRSQADKNEARESSSNTVRSRPYDPTRSPSGSGTGTGTSGPATSGSGRYQGGSVSQSRSGHTQGGQGAQGAGQGGQGQTRSAHSGTRSPQPRPMSASGKPIPPPPGGPVMRSSSGKPIPPPPGGPPRSRSGRPIPPPPGGGAGRGGQGRGGQGPGQGGGGQGGGQQGPGQGGGRSFGPRQGGGQRPNASSTGYGGRGGGPGGGGFGGRDANAFGGAPGGPGGLGGGRGGTGGAFGGRGNARPAQRKKKRRRVVEELEPIQNVRYVPSSAPVPEGEVIVERGSTAQELGPKLNRSAADVVRFLLQQGEMVTATQSLSDDAIELFAAEIGAELKLVDPGEEKEAELAAKYFSEDDDEDPTSQRTRPPVITVMGHVDHGKTSLLDKIRASNVTAGEAGGITQHIGAYQVLKNGREITFIDTPGHEAFTAMRARGADVTDVVVLVVAADDGVMPQTIEAINHAKAAEVPIVVAINKTDRADANPDRIMQQLSEHGLIPEAWGGETIMIPVSALQGVGIDELLEQLLLVADLEELTANPEGRARGFVLEGNLDVGRGPVATVVVQRGTLRVGDPVVAGAAWGKVRALIDYNGDNVKEATPSMPVQVLGLSDVPGAGDELRATLDERTARTVGQTREQRSRLMSIAGQRTTTAHVALAGGGAKLEDLFEQIQRGESATLNLILKADVQGSLEALTESLRKLEREEVKVAFIHRAVGGITENDVQLASASGATIIGFNVRPDRKARELAEQRDVEIRTYEIIYRVIEDMQKAMLGLLAPEYEEVVTGDAEVREIFRVPKIGAIAGCYVTNGVITRGSKVRFLRDGVVIWKGAVNSLRRFKDDVKEVQTGFECGIGLTDFQDLKEGDVIETFLEREISRA